MSNGIEIRQTLPKDLKGSTFICGLPGVGLVGNIVANFLVNNLKLEQIGIIDGFAFPSISVVKDGIPNHPMRLYAGEQVCNDCLLYTSPSPRDLSTSRMPSSA